MAKYMNSAEKAEDNRSSAWTLLIVGGLGLLVIILGAFGIIPLPMSGFGKKMTLIVMGALCVLFVVMGFVSFKKSKEYASQAELEGDRESNVINWFKENYPADKIDEVLGQDLFELSIEELYFKRFSVIKQLLYVNFPDTGMQFQDHMADEVYENLFGEE